MADLTLTVGAYTFTFNDGDVDRIQETITPAPEPTQISGTGPKGTYIYDYEGVIKTITISGYLTNSGVTRIPTYSIDTIYEQKQWLESLANGAQVSITLASTYATQSVYTSIGPTPPFISTFSSTTCMCSGMNFYEMSGDPLRLKFDMQFIVGQ